MVGRVRALVVAVSPGNRPYCLDVLRLGYNTNGLAHHRLVDALRLVADLGYDGVALTLDVAHLDPFRTGPSEAEAIRGLAERLDLRLTVETGARFLLDPRRKHYPTLLEREAEARARRVAFLERSIELAAELGAPVVSIWSGAAPEGVTGDAPAGTGAHSGAWETVEACWWRLLDALPGLLASAAVHGVTLAFEPEPGMFIERPGGFRELRRRLGADGEQLGLTLDVGHLVATGDLPVENLLREHAAELVHVHLDDCPAGLHEHRMFGEGDLDLPAALGALQEIGFDGLAAVELSRDSHRGAWAAEEALRLLRRAATHTG